MVSPPFSPKSAQALGRALILWGAGGHARVVAETARLCGWDVGIFIDEFHAERDGESFFGGTVRGGREAFSGLREVAVGLGVGDCQARADGLRRARAQGLELPPLLHPSACVSASAVVKEGTFIAPGAVVNAGAILCEAVIVNTSATVDHDCHIGTAVHLAPGSHLAGNVSIGEGTLIGLGALVIPGIRIGRDCTIGAGAVVVADLPDGVVAYGVPAKIQPRENQR